MTKKELTELVLNYATVGRKHMVEDHGDFRPRSLIVDLEGKHNIVITDFELHSHRFAAFLAIMAIRFGGADAILVQSDVRYKAMTKEEVAARVASDRDIQDDVRNPEALLTVARSHGHMVAIFCNYKRTPSPDGDVIEFDLPEPIVDDRYEKLQINMIPDIWKKAN